MAHFFSNYDSFSPVTLYLFHSLCTPREEKTMLSLNLVFKRNITYTDKILVIGLLFPSPMDNVVFVICNQPGLSRKMKAMRLKYVSVCEKRLFDEVFSEMKQVLIGVT